MNFSPDAIAQVRSAADIASVVAETTPLTGRGKDLFGLCPFHSEKTPSFSVNPEKGVYYCFGCGAKGDVIDYVMQTRSISFVDAVRELAAKFGVTLTEDSGRTGPDRYGLPKSRCEKGRTRGSDPTAPAGSAYLSPEWIRRATAFVLDRHARLLATPAAIRKLEKTRGIAKETVKRFYLGINPEDYWRPRSIWGLPYVTSRDGKIYRNIKIDRGLVIPYAGHVGADLCVRPIWAEDILPEPLRVTRIRIRCPEGDPKYKIVPGSNMAPMIIPGAARVVVVVESELCAMLISQEITDLATIIAMGSAQAKPDAATHRILTGAHIILNALDYDEPGYAASMNWQAIYPNQIRHPIPEGKDPTDAFVAGCDLRAWILSGIPGADYLGASAFGRKYEGNGKKLCVMDPAADAPENLAPKNIPAAVLRLADLLNGSPVVIVNGESRVCIKEPKPWTAAHWERSREISSLVYFNSEVFDWICRHPEKAVTGKNIIER